MRNSHNSHKGNRVVMRLRSRRRRRLRPRPPLRPKTDRAPSLPATHSPGSTLPSLSRRRLLPRPERSESVSCHHPELTAQAIPHYRLHLVNPPGRRPIPRQTTGAGSGARGHSAGLAKGKQGLVASTCLLSPFPLAGPLVVVGKTALDHIAAPLIARHDECNEVAAAEKKAPNAITMTTGNNSSLTSIEITAGVDGFSTLSSAENPNSPRPRA